MKIYKTKAYLRTWNILWIFFYVFKYFLKITLIHDTLFSIVLYVYTIILLKNNLYKIYENNFEQLKYVLMKHLWNQGLVNLDFDDNKIRFETNDYISSVIRQEDCQSGDHKNKIK